VVSVSRQAVNLRRCLTAKPLGIVAVYSGHLGSAVVGGGLCLSRRNRVVWVPMKAGEIARGSLRGAEWDGSQDVTNGANSAGL